MQNMSIDLKAPFNTKGEIGLAQKDQDQSLVGQQHAQSKSFIKLLEAKSTQTTNSENKREKTEEGADLEITNTDFSDMSVFIPLPVKQEHKLREIAPLSSTQDIKSLSLAAETTIATLFHPTVKTTKNNVKEDSQNSAMLVPEVMLDQDQLVMQHPYPPDENSSISPITITVGGESLPSSDNREMLSALQTLNEATIKKLPENRLKQITQQEENRMARNNQVRENSTTFEMESLSVNEEKTSNKVEPSDVTSTSQLDRIINRNYQKSAEKLTMENSNQLGQSEIDNPPHDATTTASNLRGDSTSPSHVNSGFGNQTASHIRPAKSPYQIDAGFMDNPSEALQKIANEPSADTIFSDLRRMTFSHHDNRIDAVIPKEDGYVVTVATQKPIAVESDKVAEIGKVLANDLQVELPADKAVFMKSHTAGSTAADQDDQLILNAALDFHPRTTNRNESPFRVDMANILSTQPEHYSFTHSLTGINTQAVIDQIIDAKQLLNNGFGRARITLDPPNLGTVNLEIVVRKERVEVVITADSSGVQQALQARVDDIRTALQRQDLKIETFQVLLQENSANQQQADSGSMFRQHQEHQARQDFIMDDRIPVQPLSESARQPEMVRGLVSVFV